jgi:hypothetical protein
MSRRRNEGAKGKGQKYECDEEKEKGWMDWREG